MIRQRIILDHTLHLEAGGKLENASIVYYSSKQSYAPSDKVIVICHALTANADPEDWWPQMVGPGCLFDTEKYFIFCVAMLASPYGESGPSQEDPSSGRPYYFDYPSVTVRDMVCASIEVRKALGIEKIDLLVGSSIGGFQAFEWAVMEPDCIVNAAFMATSPKVSPWLVASVEAQRMALEADPSFRECASLEGGREGLKCARAQALISYRSFEGYDLTQAEPDTDTLFAERAASYERYQGEKLARRFDAYSYYYLCNAITSNNVGRGRGGLEKALSTIKARSVVVMIDSDGLFPVQEGIKWYGYIPGTEFMTISSKFGHDGFLLEYEQLTSILKRFL